MGLLARRYAARCQWAWAVSAGVLGPVVLLVFAGLHTLPRREPCPACGAKRRLGNRSCPHCGKTFDPAQSGTEIFGGSL